MRKEMPLSAFGEGLVVNPKPEVQINASAGLLTLTDVETFTATGGAASVENTGTGYEYKCSTGTSIGGYGVIRSKRYLHYRPGQGAVLRFTARFPIAGVANSALRAGGVTSGTELSFGYDGANGFGVLYRTGGVLEIQTLTLSAPATGNETATVTLNGVAKTVSLTNGTAAHNCFELVDGETYTGWNAYQNGSTVVFVYASTPGYLSGAFTFSSTGTAAGTFAETTPGVTVTDRWIYQSAWNLDKCDGTGPSGFTLDPSKGNVYQITFQYLGYGQIVYSIENPADGRFLPVHRIQYTNNNTSPSLLLPSLKVGWFAASLGSSTDLQVYGACGAAFTEGIEAPYRNPFALSHTKTGIGTSSTNVISLRVRPVINGTVNPAEIRPLFVSASSDSATQQIICRIWINPTVAGEPNWTYFNQSNSIIEYDTAGTTVTVGSGHLLAQTTFAKNSGDKIDLSAFRAQVIRGDIITVSVEATGGTTAATVAITWLED